MLNQIDLTLDGLIATHEVNGEQVVIVLTNEEVAKANDVNKLVESRLKDRLKVLAAADRLRGGM